jgi:hypothetical protein
MAIAVAVALADRGVCFLRHHGLLAIGADLDHAFRAASVVGGALLPSMQGVLDRGTVISSDELLSVYTAAALSTYEGGRPRPIDYLRTHIMVADPRFADAIQLLRDVSFAAHPGLREYTSFNAERGVPDRRRFSPRRIRGEQAEAHRRPRCALRRAKHAAARLGWARARGVIAASHAEVSRSFSSHRPKVMDLVERFAALTATGRALVSSQ